MAFKRVEPLRGGHCDTGQVGMPKQHELFPLHEELLPPLFSKAMGIPSAPGVRFHDSGRRWPIARRPESSLHVSPSAFREPALRRPPTTADLMAGMATSTGAGQPSGVSATGPGATATCHRYSGEPSLAPMAPSVSHDTLRESSENASLMHLAANMQTGVPSILGPGGDSTCPRLHALDRSSPLASGPPSSNPRSEDEDEALALRPTKKSRLVWTEALHDRFIKAVDKCGGLERAVPKRIMEEMGLSGLTRENVASHLQKYRLYLKRGKCGDQKSRQSKG